MMADIYFWRQLSVLATILFYAAGSGLMIAYPSVLNPALLSPNSTDIKATSDQASWITAINGFAGAFGFFILSPVMQIYGRKAVHIFSNAFLFVGWIILCIAHSTTELYVGRIIQGFSIGGAYINTMIIGEYCDPKRRGYFITIKNVGISAGPLMCHALSLIWNWRQIAIFGAILSAAGIILTLMWHESPSHLAMKGRIKQCEKSYKWLRGCENIQELDALISSQRLKLQNPSQENWYKSMFRSDFVKPFIIVSLLTLLMDLCGKYYFVVYVIQIMVELIGDNSTAIYCSIGADLLIISALLTSCIVIRYFKRRSMLLAFGVSTVALMLLISIVIGLKLSSTAWVTPALILILCFFVNVGLIPVSFALIAEIFPLEHKGSGSCATGVVFSLLYTLILKLTPVLMDHTGVEGVYAIYGISIGVCFIVSYIIVPETKDRTLHDIENEFKRIAVTECNEAITLTNNN